MFTDNFKPYTMYNPLLSDTCMGYIDSIKYKEKFVLIEGWGLTRENGNLNAPDHFFIAYDSNIIGKVHPNVLREDVGKAYPGAPALCGFSVEVPINLVAQSPLDYLSVYVEAPDGSLGEMEGPDGLSAPLHAAIANNMPQKLKHMLSKDTIDGIALSLSSNCNLRCLYCCIRDDHYIFQNMKEETLSNIIAQAKKLNVQEFCLGLSGEPLLSKNFISISQKIIDYGFRISCTTNLGKLLNEKEIEVLSKFHTIEVSIDTFNRNHLKMIRHPVKLEIIVHNILQIKIAGQRHSKNITKFTFNVVLNELTIFDFPDLVHAAKILGVSHLQIFYMRIPTKKFDMSKCPKQLDNSIYTDDIKQIIKKCIAELDLSGITYTLEKELLQFIFPITSNTKKITRRCILPWSHLFILADGVSQSCCFLRVGIINEISDIKTVFNSPRVQRLRYELLSGNLRKECATCTLAEPCTIEELEELITNYSPNSEPNGAFGDPVHFVSARIVLNKP